jgi:hypothetical protein
VRLLFVLFASCGADASKETSTVGQPCEDTADCGDDFECEDVGGAALCTAHCSEDADCGAGGRCVDVGTAGDPSRTCLRSCDGDPDSCPESTTCVVWASGPAAACR